MECSVEGCDKKHFGRGYCNAHYKRWRKTGDPLKLNGPKGPPPRFQGGERVGRLTVLEQAPKVRRGRDWRCRCDCGTEVIVSNVNLGRNTFSCGCLAQEGFDERLRGKRKTHGLWGSPTWNSWESMRARCYRPGCNSYHNYGGRGITVCPRWLEPKGRGFMNFVADMGQRLENKTLDRIDVNGNYEPGNCRWATRSEQRANTRKVGATL